MDLIKKLLPNNSHVHFALKANNQIEVLKTFVAAGFGADVVSLGEIERAIDAGFKPSSIIFSGVGKTKFEITSALEKNIAQINIESGPELERIIDCAKELSKPAKVALRVNPDVEAKTHPHIRTGFRDNKFGVGFTEVSELLDLIKKNSEHVKLIGLTLHIGSQICDIEPFSEAIRKTLDLYKSIEAQGFDLSVFDVGGGLGIDYKNSNPKSDEDLIEKYFLSVRNLLENQVQTVAFEPGRVLVARCGVLLTEVQYVKRTPYKSFVIVDTGMHHLLRPALYEAYHRIELVRKSSSQIEVFDVVGPICESTDVLGSARALPSDIKSGDILAIYDVGAYGAVMGSRYNLHEMAKEVALG